VAESRGSSPRSCARHQSLLGFQRPGPRLLGCARAAQSKASCAESARVPLEHPALCPSKASRGNLSTGPGRARLLPARDGSLGWAARGGVRRGGGERGQSSEVPPAPNARRCPTPRPSPHEKTAAGREMSGSSAMFPPPRRNEAP